MTRLRLKSFSASNFDLMLTDQRPLDFSYLIQMVGDDKTFLIDFFEAFILQTPVYLAEMADALLKENWSKVANSVHKIKPTFSYIGRNDVKEFVQAIEDHARNKIALETIQADVERLKLICVIICQQLELEKNKLTSKQ